MLYFLHVVPGYAALIKFMHGSPVGISRAVQLFQDMWYQVILEQTNSQKCLLIPKSVF